MKELLEKYPKAAKVVREYYLNKLLESLKDKGLPEDFKEEVRKEGLPEEQIIRLLEANPYALVDVFDKNGIYINIQAFKDSKGTPLFGYFIEEEYRSTALPDRKTAEQGAIEIAMKLLEEKL